MGRASGGSNTPHWIRNNILDFLREVRLGLLLRPIALDWTLSRR